MEHDIHGGELSFDLWSKNRISHLNTFVAAQNTRRKSYYGSELDPDAYGRTHDLVVTAGAQYTHNFTRLMFMPAEFIAGIEYNHNYLNDVTIGYDHRLSQRVIFTADTCKMNGETNGGDSLSVHASTNIQ